MNLALAIDDVASVVVVDCLNRPLVRTQELDLVTFIERKGLVVGIVRLQAELFAFQLTENNSKERIRFRTYFRIRNNY